MTFEVIPTEKGLVKAWTRGVPFEEAARKQVENTAALPFIFKHIAIMPDVHMGKGATIGSVIATDGAIIPAAVGGDIGCFVGETLIPLLDGTQATLFDLASRSESFWVYSVNRDLAIVPGRARALRTRHGADLVEVTVSGGACITCTPDHQFMLRDGSYRRADALLFNDSLMPLYRRYESRDGYESVLQPHGRTEPTHKMVARVLFGAVDTEIIHHTDLNHFNNTPENLSRLTAAQHSRLHRKLGGAFTRPGFQEKRLAALRVRGFFSDHAKKAADGIANLVAGKAANPTAFAANFAAAGKRGALTLRRINASPRACGFCPAVLPNLASYRWHKQKEHSNHKVLNVRRLDKRADVYCLQVEEHNNFALSAGVFVHNCGMMATRLNVRASDLPDNLHAMRSAIEAAIPHGRTDNGGANDRGAWGEVPSVVGVEWARLEQGRKWLEDKHPKVAHRRAAHQLCSLGTGNHFVEVCLDEEDRVWVMLHSGSRGQGNAIGGYFIALAKEEMKRWFIHLPDKDLSYLPEGSEHFDDYVRAVAWAQEYALVNRTLMMVEAMGAIGKTLGRLVTNEAQAVNCHHNYVAHEHHFGRNVIVTRKGAVRAREGDLGIIPGSMGAKSFIVRGRGNADSFHSCSHGAGRAMSRTKAKEVFTLADHEAATAGVECRKDTDVIDETPGAYKSIDDVMAAQSDLVEIVHTLRQVVCVKG